MKNEKEKKFHAVEYMRAERSRLTRLYLEDKDKYFKELAKAGKEFMKTRKQKPQEAA